ncbi:MAG: hypothetical protein KGI38_01860 [Thaumarchaeota archaeon]|nr:hypothetical protein [Nitrososphaerota archaeon]
MSGRARPGGQGIPHIALVSSDWEDRNRLIDSILARVKVRWDGATIMSAQPAEDAKFFNRKARIQARRLRLPPSTYDVREILSRNPDPSDEILSTFKAARRNSPPGFPPLIIGDWAHLSYDDFDAVLNTERKVEEASLTAICCYRQEGFYSLDPKQIIGVFETHRQTLLGSATFRPND